MWGTKSMLSGLNDGNAGHESMQIEKKWIKEAETVQRICECG